MSESVPMTKGSYEKLKAQLQQMKTVERYKISKAIEEARGHGDLSENAEYDAAKDKQGILEARINILEDKLANAVVIDPATIDDDKVRFGATVTLVNVDTDEEKTYQIVGEDEADLKTNKISIKSPLARVLIGKGESDYVEFEAPGGRREFEIISVEYK